MLEEHYFELHHVVLQPSCCAPAISVPDHYGHHKEKYEGGLDAPHVIRP